MFDVPLLAFCLSVLTAQKSHAIVDANNNGLSDLWEKANNGGELFPSTFDPLADPDGDGWTNAQEAAAGTDPFDPNPPDGFIRPALEHSPAVYITGENGPELLSPEAYVLTCPTLIGKQYTLLFSADLAEGTWVPVGAPAIATETEALAGVTIAQPDGSIPPAIFWRVAVSDTDSDGDTLTSHEEYLLGTNPLLADTNGNGIPDPADPDTWAASSPGGGTSGGSGGAGGTPATPPEPLFMNYSSKYYHEFCLAYLPDANDPTAETTYAGFTYGESQTINRAFPGDPTYPDNNIHTTLSSVLSGLDEVALQPLETIDTVNRPQASSSAEHGFGPVAFSDFDDFSDGDDSTGDGSPMTSRFWIERLHPEDKVRSLTYLKLHETYRSGKLTAIDSVKLRIPANALHSDEVELKTRDDDSYIELARFSVEDNKFATGVDNVSNTVEDIAGSGYQDMPWIMAPCGGSVVQNGVTFPVSNDIVVNIGSAISGPMAMTCPDAMATPGEVSWITGEDLIHTSWKGTGNTSGDKIPVFKFGTGADQISAILPVRVKVMKKRTVSVTIHPLRHQYANAPVHCPSEAFINQRLNEIFGAQINAWFKTKIAPDDSFPYAFKPEYDVSRYTSYYPSDAINGMLTAGKFQITADINVFLIGGVAFYYNGGQAEGATDSSSNKSIVSVTHETDGPLLSDEEIVHTIAHEIGHIILGGGHPDAAEAARQGDAPLTGTDRTKRLMYTYSNHASQSNLMVKTEWDKAEEWLNKYVKDPQ